MPSAVLSAEYTTKTQRHEGNERGLYPKSPTLRLGAFVVPTAPFQLIASPVEFQPPLDAGSYRSSVQA